tara:strand:- start:7750 stop:8298 length:549 start_codon:yes stop_codon:yes gene_type:complete
MDQKIEIPLSRNKLFLGIIFSILFVIVGIWLFINAEGFDENSIRLLRNPMVIKIIGVTAVLFFGSIGVYGLKKMLDKKVGLVIDSNGITDNSNASSIGLIEWSDIMEIRMQKVMSTKFLIIDVLNPENYIGKAKSNMKAKLMRANMKMYGSPLSITSNTLKYNFDELEKVVQEEFEKSKNER